MPRLKVLTVLVDWYSESAYSGSLLVFLYNNSFCMRYTMDIMTEYMYAPTWLYANSSYGAMRNFLKEKDTYKTLPGSITMTSTVMSIFSLKGYTFHPYERKVIENNSKLNLHLRYLYFIENAKLHGDLNNFIKQQKTIYYDRKSKERNAST